MASNVSPTSVNFTIEDRAMLGKLHDRTGMSRTELLRRLMYALAQGQRIYGLPKIDPPIE